MHSQNVESQDPQSSLSLEGLDDVYDVSDGIAEEEPGNSKGTANNEKELPGIAGWVSVEDAGKRLGISANAVIKRLGKGKLKGRKVPGQFGEKWLVDPGQLPQEIEIDLQSAQTGTAEEEPGNSQSTAPKEREQPGYSDGIAIKSLDLLGEVIRQQTDQIRVQNEVIKHLSDEVKSRDSQIRLLTDGQRKRGMWARFYSWFLGAKS